MYGTHATYRQFLILGNIEAYHWPCGFLHVSAIQLVIQSVLLQFMYTVYTNTTGAHVFFLGGAALLVLFMCSCVVNCYVFMKRFYEQTRMWANAERDGRSAEYRWCPLSNAAKFG